MWIAKDLEASWGSVILIIITSSTYMGTTTSISTTKLATARRWGTIIRHLRITRRYIHIQPTSFGKWGRASLNREGCWLDFASQFCGPLVPHNAWGEASGLDPPHTQGPQLP
jgi:hypothetical protein